MKYPRRSLIENADTVGGHPYGLTSGSGNANWQRAGAMASAAKRHARSEARRRNEEPPADWPEDLQNIRVSAIVDDGQTTQAGFIDKDTGQSVMAKEGATYKGYKVLAVDSERQIVTLEKDGELYELGASEKTGTEGPPPEEEPAAEPETVIYDDEAANEVGRIFAHIMQTRHGIDVGSQEFMESDPDADRWDDEWQEAVRTLEEEQNIHFITDDAGDEFSVEDDKKKRKLENRDDWSGGHPYGRTRGSGNSFWQRAGAMASAARRKLKSAAKRQSSGGDGVREEFQKLLKEKYGLDEVTPENDPDGDRFNDLWDQAQSNIERRGRIDAAAREEFNRLLKSEEGYDEVTPENDPDGDRFGSLWERARAEAEKNDQGEGAIRREFQRLLKKEHGLDEVTPENDPDGDRFDGLWEQAQRNVDSKLRGGSGNDQLQFGRPDEWYERMRQKHPNFEGPLPRPLMPGEKKPAPESFMDKRWLEKNEQARKLAEDTLAEARRKLVSKLSAGQKPGSVEAHLDSYKKRQAARSALGRGESDYLRAAQLAGAGTIRRKKRGAV